MKKFLVTGGLGFLGAPLVRLLLSSGHQVRVLDNGSRGCADRLGDVSNNIEMINGDVRDADAVQKAIRGMDAVCHLAFINGTEFFYQKPAYVLEVGIKGMMSVLDGCKRENVGELILASSSEVYQTPSTIPTDETVPLLIPDVFNPRYSYAGGKIISELLAVHYGKQYFQRVMIFRPHNVYGPNMGYEHVIPQFITRLRSLIRAIGKTEILFPIQGSGEQTRSFVYIDDFISGLRIMLEKGQHLNIYNIGTTEEVKIQDVARQIAEYFGVKIHIESQAPAEGGTLRRCPNIQKMRALGYRPRISLKEGLSPTIDWYVRHEAERHEKVI